MEQSVTQPSVSVVIPVYNGVRFIQESINSVLTQTIADIEIIVVDDGSTDGTTEVVLGYTDARVRLVRLTQNCGPAEARNAGIRQAMGKYIAMLDADDIAEPTRFAEQIEAMEQDKELVCLGCWGTVINGNSRPTGKVLQMQPCSDALGVLLLFRNQIMGSSVMFRRQTFPEVSYPNIPMAEDYSFIAAMSKLGKVGNIPKFLMRVRRDGTSLTYAKQELMTECVGQILKQQLEGFGVNPSIRELQVHQHIGRLIMRSSISLLEECDSWLHKLIQNNEVIHRFEPNTFRSVASKEWFELCKHASPAGFVAWRRYWRSDLSRVWQPSTLQCVRFLAKCAVRHRREGGDLPKFVAT
ncbi:MAG: glycosyltransferase family A protein [Nitrospirota bacterium]